MGHGAGLDHDQFEHGFTSLITIGDGRQRDATLFFFLSGSVNVSDGIALFSIMGPPRSRQESLIATITISVLLTILFVLYSRAGAGDSDGITSSPLFPGPGAVTITHRIVQTRGRSDPF